MHCDSRFPFIVNVRGSSFRPHKSAAGKAVSRFRLGLAESFFTEFIASRP
jgi:hypothetical protein